MAAAPAAGGGAPPGQDQQRGGMGSIVHSIMQALLIFNLISYFTGSGGGSNVGDVPPGATIVENPYASLKRYTNPDFISPLWRLGDRMDISVKFDAYYPTDGYPVLNSTLLAMGSNELLRRGLEFPTYYSTETIEVFKNLSSSSFPTTPDQEPTEGDSETSSYPLQLLKASDAEGWVRISPGKFPFQFLDTDLERETMIFFDLEKCHEKNCTIVSTVRIDNLDKELEAERRLEVRDVITGWTTETNMKLKNLFDDDGAGASRAAPGWEDEEEDGGKVNSGEETAAGTKTTRHYQYIRPDIIINPVVDGTNHSSKTLPDVTRAQYINLLPLSQSEVDIILQELEKENKSGKNEVKDEEEADEDVGYRRRKKKKAPTSQINPNSIEDELPSAGELKKEEGRVFEPSEEGEEEKEGKELVSENNSKPPTLFDRLYFPIVYLNDFWTLKEHLFEINTTTLGELKKRDESTIYHQDEGEESTTASSPTPPSPKSMCNFTVKYYPMGIFKFMMYTQYEQSMQMHESWGTMAKDEKDNTKRIFLETNPILLGVTMVVTLLHLVFEYLAFKNDVQFWKGKKNFKGLSVRAVVMNCYFQLVIFLYLLDGETSWSVSIPSGIGVLIEFWKLRKVMKVKVLTPEEHEEKKKTVQDQGGKAGLFTKLMAKLPLNFTLIDHDKGKTKKYDRIALRYLSYVGVPCLIGYTIYSALYDSHKGWYSFIIRTQVRFIYFSGFAQMCPQIYINYKLKSVSALPWRTFVYKALNTFIDDLFAFIIKMPTMHRLACFRDDIVFFILLYQRWIYPVDPNLQDGSDAEEEEEGDDGEKKKVLEDKKKGDADADKEMAGALRNISALSSDGVSAKEQFESKKTK